MHEPIRIITISRLFGAGGSSLAEALGERLGWKVLDRALVAEVARRLQRPEADVAAIDEQVLGPWERAAAFASAAFPEMPIPPLHAYLNASIVSTVKEVLLDEAAAGPIVVVGHGTQCIFRDRRDALHLRLVAPLEQRVEAAIKRLNLDKDAARKHVRQADDDRAEYLRYVHGIDCTDAVHYDLVINTRGISIDDSVDLIMFLVGRSSK